MTALPSSGSFTMVDPTHVAAVGPAAAMVFARIEWRCKTSGEWRATRSDIASETGLSASMIRTALDVLRAHEWITARRTSTLDATLIWEPIHAGQAERRIPPSRDGGITPTPPADSAISSIETGKDIPHTPADGGALFDQPVLRSVPSPAELDAEFVRFWGLYPRKTGKIAARKAYAKARRTTSVQQLAAGLRRQLPDLTGRETRFIPHPATWLNEGRWDDEDQAPARVDQDQAAWEAALPPPPKANPFL